MKDEVNKVVQHSVFSPDNEPYLGREAVYHFDQVIISCLEANSKIAPHSHKIKLSRLQQAACQIIPQGINLALTIRELVRQGYLFGALILMRPLIERVANISYLQHNPDKLEIWHNGWRYKQRPELSDMLRIMSDKIDVNAAKEICSFYNHIVHGDPIGANSNLIRLNDGSSGYSVGKIINDPQLCDFICFQSYCYLIVLMGMMVECFPDSLKS